MTPTREEIGEIVSRLILERTGGEVGSVDNESTFASLKLDSLDHVELIMKVEDKFDGLAIPDQDASRIHNVRSLVDYLDHRINKTPLPHNTLQAPPNFIQTNVTGWV